LMPILALTSLVLGGGHGTDAAEPAPAAAPRPAASSEPDAKPVDSRDQYALAHAIQDARAARQDLESTLARTRADWVGRRYRWQMAFVPALCGPVGPCVVMPFDHAHDPDHPIRQGWLPRLELSAEQRTSMAEACEAHARCVIDISGTLDRFELSTEQPTSLTLTSVELHGTRAATASESWVLGTSRGRPRRTARRPDATTPRHDPAIPSGVG
ncbi:MAG: hypothetical protein KDK70_06515, partial [Myxococcales bacterium]|nr:hypothetical protein [Myxococcales bacterium]